jgi:glycine cleavage system H protein
VADPSYPTDLRYHVEHGWARIEGGAATFGVTWYAQDNLQEVVHVAPPTIGERVAKDDVYAEIESVKTVSDLYAPLSGEIVEVNVALRDAPVMVNEDPYQQGWLVKVNLSDPSEAASLMDADEYEATL